MGLCGNESGTMNLTTLRAGLGRFIAGKAASPALAAWVRGQDTVDTGGSLIANVYQQCAVVYACCQVIAENLSAIEFRFSTADRNGAAQLVSPTDATLSPFWRPSDQMDRIALHEMIVLWLKLRGEAFVLPLDANQQTINLRRPGARPDSLWLLPPDMVNHVVMNNRLAAWRYSAGSQDAVRTLYLLPEEVVQIKLPNPYHPWRGMSPLTVARTAADADFAAAVVMKGMMRNNGSLEDIVESEQPLNDDQRAMIRAALRERRRGAGAAANPLVLEGGLKFVKPSLSSADQQFLEHRKFNRQELCMIYRVPQELLGYTEDANRSVADAARLNFQQYTLEPLARRIEIGLEPVVSACLPGCVGRYHTAGTPASQAARIGRADVAVKYWGMGVPLAELNEALDLGLPEDIAGAEVGYLPFSVQPVGAGAGEEPLMTPMGADGTDGTNGTDGTAQDAFARLQGFLHGKWQMADGKEEAKGTGEQETKGHGAREGSYQASLQPRINRVKSKVKRFFFGQRSRVLKRLAAKLTKQSERTKALTDEMLDPEEEMQQMLDLLKPGMLADLGFGGMQLMGELSLPETFKIPPEEAIAFLKQRENRLADTATGIWEKVRDSLSEGLDKGESLEELTTRVREAYGEMTEARAERVAVTETNTAVNSGRMIGMTAAGVEKKAWLTSHLENTRESHMACEAEGAIPVDQAFSNGLMFPGDPEGDAGEVINCRCHLMPVVDRGGRE